MAFLWDGIENVALASLIVFILSFTSLEYVYEYSNNVRRNEWKRQKKRANEEEGRRRKEKDVIRVKTEKATYEAKMNE